MAAPNAVPAGDGTQVIKANLMCAKVKLRIENVTRIPTLRQPLLTHDQFQFETLRSLTSKVESEEFSAPSGDAGDNGSPPPATPIIWQLVVEFGVQVGEFNSDHQFQLKHKKQLPSGTKVVFNVKLINAAGNSLHTVKEIIELQASTYPFIAISASTVKDALRTNGALLVNCAVRYLQPPSNGAGMGALPRYRPDDSSHREDLRQLFASGHFSDFAIEVGNETIPVHKGILAQRSAVFCALLNAKAMNESEQGFMTIADFEPQPIKAMLEYIYTGSITDSKQVLDEWGESLLAAAEKYAVLALKELVESHIASTINARTLATIASLADTYSAQRLTEACANYVAEHHRELVTTPEWQSFKARKPDLVLELAAHAVDAAESGEGLIGPYMPEMGVTSSSGPSSASSVGVNVPLRYSAPRSHSTFSTGSLFGRSYKDKDRKWYRKLGKLLKD